MPYHRPRMFASLTVPNFGKGEDKIRQNDTTDVTVIPVHPRKAHLSLNDLNHADELRLIVDYKEAGLDPRVLTNATVAFYMADELEQFKGADPELFNIQWAPTGPNDLKFVGIMTRPARQGSEDEGLVMSLEFQDYTSLFIQNKHYPPEAAPSFNMTLSQAWALICDNTGPVGEDGKVISTVKALRDRIKFQGVDDILVGDAVVPRLAKLGKIQIAPDWDSWKVWQQCVGSLGLISFIELDNVVITTDTNYFTVNNPPVFVWGQNIYSINEERNSVLTRKGIRIKSYDPLTNSTLEALYPPKGDKRILKKTTVAKTGTGKSGSHSGPTLPSVDHTEDREEFDYPAVTSQERLDIIAKRVWMERMRQELEGTIVTYNFKTSRVNLEDFDILNLRAGDTITVSFDPTTLTLLKSEESQNKQISYLLERGYTIDVAKYIVANLQQLDVWPANFLVKGVEFELETEETNGSFLIKINYCNMINVEGGTIQ